MNVLDLFSGIGGFALGLERAGMKTVAFCEIDLTCRQVLAKNFPGVPLFTDVKLLNSETLKHYLGDVTIDVIAGGFPCQDISVAGRKKGMIDEHGQATRSGLWFEFKRLIREIKPRYVIIENVANLRGNGLVTVLQDLWSLGYDAEWHIISARSVGAPHLRERIWIVAYPHGQSVRLEPRGILGTLRESERVAGDHGEVGPGLHGSDASNSDSERLQGQIQRSEENGRVGEEQNNGRSPRRVRKPSRSNFFTPDPDHVRLWKAFASSEEKHKWWTETTTRFRDWWKTESPICRVDDGLSARVDRGTEKIRAARIKQLGNTIVPFIAEFIGNRIQEYEARRLLEPSKESNRES
jgi:DNA (cytosine-5)-methyltransferase 1